MKVLLILGGCVCMKFENLEGVWMKLKIWLMIVIGDIIWSCDVVYNFGYESINNWNYVIFLLIVGEFSFL